MSEKSSTPDAGELARRFFEAADKRELHSIPSFYARDAGDEARADAERLAEERA